MRVFQKVLISLLIATVLFTAFAVAAYSGLFDLIDARFYNQRIRNNSRSLLEEALSVTEEYQLDLREGLTTFAADPAMRNIFLINQSREDIEQQTRVAGQLFDRYPELDFLRIIDNDRGQLWFSTLEDDVRNRTPTQIEYRTVGELNPPLRVPSAEEERTGVDWLAEPSALRVIIPMVDNFNSPRGILVGWASFAGVYNRLQSQGIVAPSARVLLTPDGNLVFNARRHFETEDLTTIDRALSGDDALPLIRSRLGESYALETLPTENRMPPAVILINESDLHMDRSLRIILLSAVFLVVFLAVYLILNIRQDPTLVVAERFRRFQQAVVRDYLREGRAVDPDIWKREIDSRREKIEGEITRGIGRLNEEQKTRVEQDISRNWDEMYRLMGSRGAERPAQIEPLNLSQIEEIIERTLARYGGKIIAEGEHTTGTAAPQRQQRRRKPGSEEAPVPLDVEEVEELDELADISEVEDLEEIADVEDVEDLEEIADVEEVEEVEELEEAEAPEPLDVEEVEELDELEDISEVEDLEEIADVEDLEDVADMEEVAEVEEVEEVEELEEAEEAEALEPLDVEEVEELGELEDISEVEDLEEIADVEDVEELEAEAEELSATDDLEPVEQEEPSDLDEETIEIREEWEIGGKGPRGERSSELFVIPSTALEAAESEGPSDADEEVAALEPAEVAALEPAEVEELEPEEAEELEPEEAEELEPEEAEELEEVDELEPEEDDELEEAEELELYDDADETVYEAQEFLSFSRSFLSSSDSFGGRSEPATLVFPAEDARRSVDVIQESNDDRRIRIRGRFSGTSHQVVEIEEFIALNQPVRNVIDERNGLVQIEAVAFSVTNAEVNHRVQALADQVINHSQIETIDSLFRETFEDLDFGDIMDGTLVSSSEMDSVDASDAPLRAGTDGFEMSASLEKGDTSVRNVYRQLVQLTRVWDARAALILEQNKDDSITSSFALGLPEAWGEELRLPVGCDLAENVFPYHRVVLLKQALSHYLDFENTQFRTPFSQVQSWLFLPLSSSEKPRYLMIGFPRRYEDLKELSLHNDIIPSAV